MLLQHALLNDTPPRVIWPVWFHPPPPPEVTTWNHDAAVLLHRIGSLHSGQELVIGCWSLHYLNAEEIVTQPVKEKRVAVSIKPARQQLAWWGRTAWYKDKYRDYPWTPCRRYWTKDEIVGLPYYRLCYDGAEVGIEHVRSLDGDRALQRRFAQYLAAVSSGTAVVRWLDMPDDYTIPARWRGRRVFKRKMELKGE